MSSLAEVKIDFDWLPPEQWLDEWVRLACKLACGEGKVIRRCSQNFSSGGKGLHVRFTVDPAFESAEDLCCFQFLLGDDRIRCKLNLKRIRAGVRYWNKLFSKKIKRSDIHEKAFRGGV